MTFKNVLDLNFSSTKYFIWSWSNFLHALFFKSRKVPYPDCLIEWSRCNKSIIRVECGTHDIVTMTCKNGNNTPILPIPKSYSLIITTRNDPRQLFMKFNCSNIIQMAGKSKNTFFSFVVPNLYFVIITTTDEHRLGFMEVNTPNRTIMILEFLEERLSSVIKEVDRTIMKRSQDPWSIFMER